MEYPGTKFTRPIRLTMLIVFITAFFIISPAIIMYTAGYRYDWHNGLLKETGSISIDIEPENSTIYLNNIRLQEELPIRLNNIIPAKYNLRISAPGYFDWNKEIEIKNKQTNYTKEISLIKKNEPEIVITADHRGEEFEIINFSLSHDGRFIAFTTKKDTFGVWLWDNNSQQSINLIQTNSSVEPRIVWTNNSYYAAVTVQTNSGTYSQVHIVNAANPGEIVDIAQNSQAIHKIQWGTAAEPQLYYSTPENISVYSPENDRIQPISQNSYVDWHMDGGQLWTVQVASPTQAYQIIKNTLGFSSVFNQITAADLISENENNDKKITMQILAAYGNTALVKTNVTDNMILVTNNSTYQVPAENFLVSKYGNWLLLWSDWELWTYSQGEEPNLLNRSGEQLNYVLPMDQYNTLALIWRDKATILFPYYFVSHDLLDEKITHPAADTENKILYFINSDENNPGIWKLAY